jgi:catechol 2,3-dioxygenase-like lactoylglutathione lyase family enzyme
MEPRVSFITLAVPDLDAAYAFYVDGLGWEPAMHVPDDVLMIRVGDKLLLSLWVEAGFEGEVGPIRRGEGHVPITLAHNLPTREEVDAVLEQARAAGASYVGEAAERDWGGYTGYFGDPAGYRWEVAYNPGPIGQSVLPSGATP